MLVDTRRGKAKVTFEIIEFKLWSKVEALRLALIRRGLLKLPPLEAILNALPPDYREAVRRELAEAA